MTELQFYLIGIIVAYIALKIFRKKADIDTNWESVISTIIGSLGSWGVVAILLIVFIMAQLPKLNDLNIKPPKWL